jgi:hypothetical protein
VGPLIFFETDNVNIVIRTTEIIAIEKGNLPKNGWSNIYLSNGRIVEIDIKAEDCRNMWYQAISHLGHLPVINFKKTDKEDAKILPIKDLPQ